MSECKFKVGDKVTVVYRGSGCGSRYVGRVVTITEAKPTGYNGKPGYKVSPAIGNTLSGNFDGYIGERTFELFEQTTEEKRQELSDAFNVLRKHQIGFNPQADGKLGCEIAWYENKLKNRTPEELIDHLLPLETPQQKEVREIREQQEALAERLKQLEEEI